MELNHEIGSDDTTKKETSPSTLQGTPLSQEEIALLKPEERRYYFHWLFTLYLPSLQAIDSEEELSAQAVHPRDPNEEGEQIAKPPTTVLAWLVYQIKDVTEPELELPEIRKLLKLIQKLHPYELTMEDAAYLLADVFEIWQWLFENDYVPPKSRPWKITSPNYTTHGHVLRVHILKRA